MKEKEKCEKTTWHFFTWQQKILYVHPLKIKTMMNGKFGQVWHAQNTRFVKLFFVFKILQLCATLVLQKTQTVFGAQFIKEHEL